MKKYSLEDITSSYLQKKEWEKQFPVSCYIFRPLSFYVTYLVIRLTDSPGRVAWFGFLLGIAANASFLFAGYLGLLPGILMLMAVALSDAVDGNIARTSKNVTHYGKFLDSVLGISIEGTFPFFLGLGLYAWENAPDFFLNPFGRDEASMAASMLVYGAVIMAGAVYSNKIGESYDYQRIQKEKDAKGFSSDVYAKIGTSAYSRNIFYLVFINLHAFNLQLLLLLVSYIFAVVDIFMLFFACYYAFRFFFLLFFYARRANQSLR